MSGVANKNADVERDAATGRSRLRCSVNHCLRRDVLLTYFDGLGPMLCSARGRKETWNGVAMLGLYRG